MAIKAIEGFDFYQNRQQALTRSGFLQWMQLDGDLCPGRNEGQGFQFFGGGSASFGGNMTEGYLGFAAYITSGFQLYGVDTHWYGGLRKFVITFGVDGAVGYAGIRTNDGHIDVPMFTSNNKYPIGTWVYLEIGWIVADFGSRLRVRANGVEVLTANIQTRPATNDNPDDFLYHGHWSPFINGIQFTPPPGTDRFPDKVDDFYLCDNAAAPGPNPENTFLGDHHVYTLFPSADAVTAWTSSDPAKANWQQVRAADGDASYNIATAAGTEDLFTVDALPANVSDILAVQVTGSYRKADGASHALTQRLNSGGTEAIGQNPLAPYSLSESYVFYSDIWTIDPNTNAPWQPSGLAQGVIKIGYVLET